MGRVGQENEGSRFNEMMGRVGRRGVGSLTPTTDLCGASDA